MATHENLHNLNVFLASPSDLQPERLAARQIVENLNRSICSQLGWHITLLRWEDMPPRPTRPQEMINEAVDKCELFVGLLWKKWGTSTGKDSSGFHEEFDRAWRRYQESGTPTIWLFFKEVKKAQIADPGPELQQILAFREAHRTDLTYELFKDKHAFTTAFQTWLSNYVVSRAWPTVTSQVNIEANAMSVIISQPQATTAAQSGGEGHMPTEPSQLRDITARLSSLIGETGLEAAVSGDSTLSPFEAARLYLMSTTLLSTAYVGSFLGIHEVNFLYRYRRDLHATVAEKSLLLRTLVAGESGPVPGWYWFRDLDPDDIAAQMGQFVLDDPAAEVRAGALNLLALFRVRPTEDDYLRIAKVVFSEKLLNVRRAGLNYLKRIATTDDIVAFEKMTAGEQTESRADARRLVQILKARHNPNEVLAVALAEHQELQPDVWAAMRDRSRDIRADLLVQATHSPESNMRLFAVEALRDRDQITQQLATRLAQDVSLQVREVAILTMIRHGWAVDAKMIRDLLTGDWQTSLFGPSAFGSFFRTDRADVEGVLFEFYKKAPIRQLHSAIRWATPDGPIAYRAMAVEHFAENSHRIRSDLDEEFEHLEKRGLKALRATRGAGFQSMVINLERVGPSFNAKFTSAALEGILVHGDSADLPRARRYLSASNDDVKHQALKVIQRLGERADAGEALAIAMSGRDKLKRLAAEVALKLDAGSTLHQLLRSSDPELLGPALLTLSNRSEAEILAVAEALIGSNNQSIRTQVTKLAIERISKHNLEGLLDAYINRPTYYYYLAAALDKVIYAPGRLSETFKQDIENEDA